MDGRNGEGGKERLTRDRICEVALETIDASGLESLSMRTLASALGVKASSLYYHFDSKDELLTGVAEFLYRRLGRPPNTGEWTEQVRATFVQLHDFIQAHPNAAPLLVRDLAYSPVAKKRANVLLKIVAKAGLDTDTCASLISNLVALLVGHAFLNIWLREGSGSAAESETTDGQRVMGFIIDLDGSRPWVHRLFPTAASGSSDSGGGISSSATRQGRPPVTLSDRVLAEQRITSWTAADLGAEDRWPSELAFFAGLDALIRGFAPD